MTKNSKNKVGNQQSVSSSKNKKSNKKTDKKQKKQQQQQTINNNNNNNNSSNGPYFDSNFNTTNHLPLGYNPNDKCLKCQRLHTFGCEHRRPTFNAIRNKFESEGKDVHGSDGIYYNNNNGSMTNRSSNNQQNKENSKTKGKAKNSQNGAEKKSNCTIL